MAHVTIDIAAFDRLTGQAVEGGIRSALGEGERILKSDILNRNGTGRVYGKHQASAPGEPPAPDIGNLRANTNADQNLLEEGRDIVGRIVANAEYAEALSKGSERMAPRPFFDVLANEHQNELARAFAEGARE